MRPLNFACCCNSSPPLPDSGLLSAGKPVNTLFVASKLQLTNEMYFAILLDRATAGPVMIGCSEGGTSIEELAEKHPDKIIKVGPGMRGFMLGTGTCHLVEQQPYKIEQLMCWPRAQAASLAACHEAAWDEGLWHLQAPQSLLKLCCCPMQHSGSDY